MMSEIKRRDFLKYIWGVAGLAALGEAGWVGMKFFSPQVAEGQFGGLFEVGAVADFPPGSVTPFNEGRFYLVRLSDGGFLALYRKCTHLGCAVPWEPASNKFICPCHASEFEMDGQVLNPPAPRPLDRFVVTIESGLVRVDTGATITRDQTSTHDPVYAEEL